MDIPTLTLRDKTKTSANLRKAEALNDYFSSVFTTEGTNNIPYCEDWYHYPILC